MNKKYQPLHHKYRPYTFNELVGQEAIATTLQQAIKTNRIAPAYIFSGPRGTGKTSSARILARSLNCLKSELPTIEPCGVCSLCQGITNGSALDVIEIDAASNTGVDNIRELIEKSKFAPVQARWKIYVIDECHMLSTAAFNALLKTLEEPPNQVVFVLATTDPQRVLPTILSRCQRFDFRRIPLEILEKHLSDIAGKENISIDLKALTLIAQRAQGGLRDAESMLDQLSLLPAPITVSSVWQLLGAVPEEELLTLASALITGSPISVLESCRNIIDSGKEPIAILQGLGSILRDLIIKQVAPNNSELCNISNDSNKKLEEVANEAHLDQLLQWQKQLKGVESQIRNSMQPRLWLEIQLLGMLSNNQEHPESNSSNQSAQLPNENYKSKLTINTKNPIPKDIAAVKERKISQNPSQEKVDFSNEWELIISKLELPSTKMLLSQQASLVNLSAEIAEVQVSSNWISMIQSRKNLLEEAIAKALGGPRKLILKSHVEESNIIQTKQEKPNSEKDTKEQRNNSNKKPQSKSNHVSQRNTKKPQDSLIKDSPKLKTGNHLDSLESKAKNLADFFNGEIIELDK